MLLQSHLLLFGMVSVMSVMQASRYQNRSSMYIRGLIQRNFTELVEADPIRNIEYSDRIALFLFDLIPYVPVNIFQLCRVRSSWIEPILSKG